MEEHALLNGVLRGASEIGDGSSLISWDGGHVWVETAVGSLQ